MANITPQDETLKALRAEAFAAMEAGDFERAAELTAQLKEASQAATEKLREAPKARKPKQASAQKDDAPNKINFTKAALDGLPTPAPGQRATYHDIKTNGLQVRVTSTGVKTFCVFRHVKKGSPERVTLGRYPDMTIEQARKQATHLNAEIAAGKNPAELERAKRAEMTFGEFWKEYMERYSRIRKKPRTIQEDEKTFRLYLPSCPTASYPRSQKPTANACTTILRSRLPAPPSTARLPY